MTTKKDYYGFEPMEQLFSVFCRSVGPGGTTVAFYKTASGNVKAVWSNENCPYEWKDATIQSATEECSDGHNVNELGSLEEFLAMIK